MKPIVFFTRRQIVCVLLLYLLHALAYAQPRIAVLDFELKDLTLAPGIAAELARTQSIKPMLEKQLVNAGYSLIFIPTEEQHKANAGFGYLFDHHDVAAALAKHAGADFILVGRLHKPSFLFAYLMVHLINADNSQLIAEYVVETKGGAPKLTFKAVERLSAKIHTTLGNIQK